MALYDALQTPAYTFDERTGRLSTVWKVRAPRGLALQSPGLPARGDFVVFQGQTLVVRYGRRITGLDRFNSANEADDLTEVTVDYERAADTFSGGGVDPDDPDVVTLESSIDGYDIEIPYHTHEGVTAENSAGNTEVFSVFTPAPAVYEATVEEIRVVMNVEAFGLLERDLIRAQRGKVHALDGVNPWGLFDGARSQQIGPGLTKVYYTWRELRPLTLDPTPVPNVYKPGDGPDDDATLPPFARWAAVPGAETGEGPTLRRLAPVFKAFNRREVGDPALLAGNPVQYIINGTGGGP